MSSLPGDVPSLPGEASSSSRQQPPRKGGGKGKGKGKGHSKGGQQGRSGPTAETCWVCLKNEGKYKFVCCQRRYCSIKCYKDHTSKPCTGGLRRGEDAPQRKKRKPVVELYDFQYAELSLYSSCTKDDLQELRNSEAVKSKLSHPALRKVIKRIDSADDRVAALEKQLSCDADFVAFIDECLDAVGFKYTADDATKSEEKEEVEEPQKLIQEIASDASGDGSSSSSEESDSD